MPLRYVIVRTNNDPAAMAKVVREEISKIDPSQADGDEATMSAAIVNLACARTRSLQQQVSATVIQVLVLSCSRLSVPME